MQFIKTVFIIAALVFMIGAAYGQGKKVANDSQPKVEKIVKHKKAKKKCACKCKKVVDATRKVDYNNFIGPRD